MLPTKQNYLLDFIVLFFKEMTYHDRDIIFVSLFFLLCIL